MKIAIFTDTYSPHINGVVKTLNKYTEYMDRNGIEYLIFAPAYGSETDNCRNVVRISSIKLFLYPQCRLALPKYHLIRRELDAFKPDVIHLITEFNLGLCGLRYARTHNIPLVTSYETHMAQYLRYYRLIFLEAPSWSFFRWFHGKSDISYCPSAATCRYLESKGFHNMKVWERGIELDRFSPEYRDIDLRKAMGIDDKIVFLYVGRVSPEKDLHIYMEAAKRLNLKYKDRVHYLLVGDGPSLKDLKKDAPHNMTFTGFIKGVQLSKLYASSDIFICPSATETLGFVILEAMASGLPVVCCGEGGTAENLVDGYNGFSCRSRNVDDFYNAAERLINDGELRRSMSANARRHAEKKDWDNAFDSLIESYAGIIDKRVKQG